MNIEELRAYCLSLEQVVEEMPFDDETLVFKVGGKMFGLASMGEEFWINVKCDPDEALELRETFPAVFPGYHMNKKYWNSVLIDGTISDSLIKAWIDNSYRLVVSKLTKQEKAQLGF